MTTAIVFTGQRVIDALLSDGFRGAAWVNQGGGCYAVSAPIMYAGGVEVGTLTVGNSAYASRAGDVHAAMDSVFVTVEDAVGDYFHVDGFSHDASDDEYAWAECLTMRDVVRAAAIARDAAVARATAGE